MALVQTSSPFLLIISLLQDLRGTRSLSAAKVAHRWLWRLAQVMAYSMDR
jgi:hypothetical protein